MNKTKEVKTNRFVTIEEIVEQYEERYGAELCELFLKACCCKVIIDKDTAHMKKIKEIRKKKKWSTERMGKYLGVSRRTVEGYEQGRPISGTVQKLLERL